MIDIKNNKNITIFDYMSVQLFLQDVYRMQKQMSPRFSYSSWATQLGFKNKTILRLIIQNKRSITQKSLVAFKKFFNFNNLESEYFENLIAYSQAKSDLQKKIYGSALIKLQRQNMEQIQLFAESGILSDVYSPIVFTILSSSPEPMTLEHLKKYCSLDDQRIKTILIKLIEYKLVIKIENAYSTIVDTFNVPDQYAHPQLQNYYEYWLKKSTEAIKLPYDSRRFRSLQIALTQDEFNEIVKKTNDFALTLLSMTQNNSIENRKVYLMNTALFPVKDIDHSL